ncbi:putative RING finger domain protein [Aspergillus clavatus NRRL 1]|uniref:RING finger domain protein, putative n=1 Tax=Aspergillus clavatus (strain ATCC 1007 / CBS 513.65 / DSM 816 / NCTC 3887 / NRRL 1 / QM 1276 / 107) TaxID=344612 RepID=A1CSU0_ASPCL|nr:RING finger domain protein, putative [Aspergillus clavatus NRRL 1]EAW06377.1 RING finger domain protein, putative [Aspergillus clavatus NRRL 1]
MAHSKRNTSLPHFTSYERGLLRSSWGTQRGVISRDSFLPFGSCRLCLQPARSPVVACATNGDLFCRECAISDLLAQRQEIKRLEREREEAKKRLAEDEERTLEEARRRELREFELVSMGLEAAKNDHKAKGGANGGENHRKRKAEEAEEALAAFKAREIEVDGKRKKIFELDEKEMARVAREEQERLKRELKREKSEASKSALPSFWVPSLTPTTDPNEIAANKVVKMTPICPGSTDENRHGYSLKSLVEVHFTEEKATDGTVARICPSCKKNLSNGLKAMLTKPCGHVICQPCVAKFMTPHDVPDPHASKEEQERTAALHGLILCYVCETDITPRNPKAEADENGARNGNGKKSKKKDKDPGIRPGLVPVSSEGTGFAGRGGNVATKAGVAFQC